jgi:hypothetical protein
MARLVPSGESAMIINQASAFPARLASLAVLAVCALPTSGCVGALLTPRVDTAEESPLAEYCDDRPTLDGTLDEGEWPRAIGGAVAAIGREDIHLAFRTNGHSVGHVYLQKADELHVLHASGSLGRAVYVPAANGGWELRDAFEWTARDPALFPTVTAATQGSQRDALFFEQGWAGTTVENGRDGETELRLRRHYAEGFDALALGWFETRPDGSRVYRHWPEGASIDGEPALFQGDAPPRLGAGLAGGADPKTLDCLFGR